MLKVDKKDYNDIDVYYIGYVTVNPLYLMIDEMISHLNENKEKNENKYLVLDDVMKTKKFQKNMKKFGKVLKKKLKQLMVAKKLNMRKIT